MASLIHFQESVDRNLPVMRNCLIRVILQKGNTLFNICGIYFLLFKKPKGSNSNVS